MKAVPISYKVHASEPRDILYHVRDEEGKEWVLLYAESNHATGVLRSDTLLYQQPGFTHKDTMNCRWFLVNQDDADYAIVQTDSNAGAVGLLHKLIVY
jgi:hypothetical protein